MQDLSEQEICKVAVKSIIFKTFPLLDGLQRKVIGEMREERMTCMFSQQNLILMLPAKEPPSSCE